MTCPIIGKKKDKMKKPSALGTKYNSFVHSLLSVRGVSLIISKKLPWGDDSPDKIISIFSDNNPLKGAANQLVTVLNIKEKNIKTQITIMGQSMTLSQSNQLGSHAITIAI